MGCGASAQAPPATNPGDDASDGWEVPTRSMTSPPTVGGGSTSLNGGSQGDVNAHAQSQEDPQAPRSGGSRKRRNSFEGFKSFGGMGAMAAQLMSTAREGLRANGATNKAEEEMVKTPNPYADLLEANARFLMTYVAVLEHSAAAVDLPQDESFASKPKLEIRQFKSHTMDNVRVRRMCDELLHLEDPAHKMSDDLNGKISNKGWMKTLQISVGSHINGVKLNNNPDISIGGYFIISQMLSYIKGLVTLDLSSNELTAAEARVLSIGLRMNNSLQDVRLKENAIGSEGATNIADALKVNETLLTLDLRMNSIRGPGICVLADAVSHNKTLISVDVRWNYAGECSDFVEMALLDLKDFCLRNLRQGIESSRKARALALRESSNSEEATDIDSAIQSELDREGMTPTPNGGDLLDKKLMESLELEASNQTKTTEEGGTPSTQRAAQHPDEPVSNSTEVADRMMRDAGLHSPTTLSTQGAEEHSEPPIGRVEVTILNAKNLPQVMWTSGKEGEFMGLPQAYCTCTLGKLMHQTGVMKKNWNPAWSYRCILDVQSIWNVCTLKVLHSKSLNNTHIDDYMIGMVNLPMGSITNWRGVTKGLDGTWRAFYRPPYAEIGHPYEPCVGKDRYGNSTDTFDTSEGAARAYDEVASKKEGERAILNFAGECNMIGLHVKEDLFPLAGEDGISVIGVQAGVSSCVRLQIKYFDRYTSYLEIFVDRASCLPKMDSGLGSCDAYTVIMIGDFQFRSRVVRNSLDPHFNQVYRISVPNGGEDMECRVQVWDWDRFDENDHIGDAVLRISPEKITTPGALDGEYAFIDASGTDYVRNGRGEKSKIHLRFKYYEALDPVKS